LHTEQPRKMEMLFDHIAGGGGGHFILDEAFDVEKQTIPALIEIVEANGTLQQTNDSRKSMGLTGLSSTLLHDGKAYWFSSSSLTSSAASFSTASFSTASFLR
jgi:hypothetical protein